MTLALTRTSSPPAAPGATTAPSTAPQDVGSDSRAATFAACVTNFLTVDSAVTSYLTTHASEPPAGTAWATHAGGGGPLLSSWPDDPGHYVLTWNGAELSVVPVGGPASHGNDGSASPATGCYAVK